MSRALTQILAAAALLFATSACADDTHPRLLLTADDVKNNIETWQGAEPFAASVALARDRIDASIQAPIVVPVPQDAGGGYTHEKHKSNALEIHDAGMLYQWTGDDKYARHARDLLLQYAQLYPGLGEHPKKKEQSPGRLFWQSLNEAWWLVYSIQGYDAIHDSLTASERSVIEDQLFRTMSLFLSVESPQTFDKIHNHGTWANAAVGMTGFVLGEDAYVNKALYGTKEDGKAGFIKQLDELFSPDGYYTEGPYYQRYALMPFVVFARSIENNRPELKIFEHRDGILQKAIVTTIQLSYADKFFPINDAIKDKGLDTVELSYGVAIAYGLTEDASLLSLVNSTAPIILTGDGLRLAAMSQQAARDNSVFKSALIRDGASGESGGIGILRSDSRPGHAAVLFKAASQGMGHGHFDRLNWLFFDNGKEVVRDYGAARFLNVVQKYGGHYLPENNSWAKQTVAHNTLVVDEQSHFNGRWQKGEAAPPAQPFFDIRADIELTSAIETAAYDGVEFRRTLALIKDDAFEIPVVLDVLSATSDEKHRYDLPLYANGHIIDTSVDVQAQTSELRPVGAANGYQHLWLRAKAEAKANTTSSITWILDNRFYTYTTTSAHDTEVLFTEIGADDPNFNLRKESGLIHRVENVSDHTFVGVMEAHGEYNGAREFTRQSASQIKTLEHFSGDGKDVVRIEVQSGKVLIVALSHNTDPTTMHEMDTRYGTIKWIGPYELFAQ